MPQHCSAARAMRALASLLSAVALPLAAQHPVDHSTARAAPPTELPRTYRGGPTSPDISPRDLMTRLYIFADDSLAGREVGTEYHLRATAYIERELRRLGLRPAGDSGGYFQELPIREFATDSTSRLSAAGESLALWTDVFPLPAAERRLALDGVAVIYGGVSNDSTSWPNAEQVAGKVVVLTVPTTASPFRNVLFSNRSRFAGAAAVLVVSLDRVPATVRTLLRKRSSLVLESAAGAGPLSALVTTRVAALLFGRTDSLVPGMSGQRLTGTIVTHARTAPGRNVVAVLPGADPVLRHQYVAIGAHTDHVGYNSAPVDHDSLRVANMFARPQGADSRIPRTLTGEEMARLHAMVDSLHALHGARRDSIFNGADDDGSGSMTVLEIAEAFARGRERPKRSLLFVFHAGEEKGLWGAAYFTAHPTVPRDSIVAQLNLDMVGRGRATDVTGETSDGTLVRGGPGYLQLVGSRRLSTELGDLVEAVNADQALGFRFDYVMDANGHPQNIYCRSDHYEYAKYGIPIVFFTTGGHSDYHQVTDEPQYIDYVHMAEVGRLVQQVARRVANLDHRLVVDGPKPDPAARCVQ